MRSRVSLIVACVAAMALVLVRVDARQAGSCRVGGRAASGATPLPGVSIAALADNMLKGAT